MCIYIYICVVACEGQSDAGKWQRRPDPRLSTPIGRNHLFDTTYYLSNAGVLQPWRIM